MNSTCPIPWYRLHLATCVAMMMVGAALLWIQTLYSSGNFLHSTAYYGWPLGSEDVFLFSRVPNFSWFAVGVNTVVAFTLILGTGFLFELLIRRVTSRLQFSLTAALVVIIATAVMLGERYADWNMYAIAEWLNLRPTLLSTYPWYCYVPIYIAIFCTLCMFTWMVIAIISKCCRRFDR